MGKPGRRHPSQGKSSWLLEDARQMEERLAELRMHMEKEHVERQRRLEAGRVWSSSDAPRPIVSKQQISGRGNITLESSLRQSAINRIMALGSHTQGRASLPRSSQAAENCASPSQEGSKSYPRNLKTPMDTLAPENQDSACLADGTFDEEESRQSFLAALDAWRGKPKTLHTAHPVDTASATDVRSASSGSLVRGDCLSVFRRMVLMRAMEQAGDAAAAECQCRVRNTTPRHNSTPDAALTSPSHVADERCVSKGHSETTDERPLGQSNLETSQSPGPGQLQRTQGAMGSAPHDPPCVDGLQDEDVVVISVTDVDPCQALTSRTRLPDMIVLPP